MKTLLMIALLATATSSIEPDIYTATAYCLTGKTATGRQAGPGIVAVDPRRFKLGSTIQVIFEDGTKKKFIAEDTGGDIRGNRLDFWFPCKVAIRFGRQKVKVVKI